MAENDTTTVTSPRGVPSPFVVTTRSGQVQGLDRTHDVVFYSIPYAAPLSGISRFAKPEPPLPWDGIRDCTAPGSTAQDFSTTPNPTIPEVVRPGAEKLNLTIYAPKDALPQPGKLPLAHPLPVFVWIHGGSFIVGENACDWWDGAKFTAAGVIVVTINYRLDAEGWLPLPDAPQNRGMLDQLAALQWVQRNISAFGGDPQRVTIGGQSAGGTSALCLASNPAAQGLFQQVFSCSPAFVRLPADGGAKGIVKAARRAMPFRTFTADALSQWPLQKMEKLSLRMRRSNPLGLPFYPVRDKATQPQSLTDAADSALFQHYPMLIGSTSEEFDSVTFNGALKLLSRLGVEISLSTAGVDPSRRNSVIAAHHDDIHEGRVGAVMSDTMIRATVATAIEGRVLDQPAEESRTWVYDYRWPGRQGAAHCADLPIWFGTLGAKTANNVVGPVTTTDPSDPTAAVLDDAAGQTTADLMHSALQHFIADGNPGWPTYNETTRVCMVWDEKPHVEMDCYRAARSTWGLS
ncbi:carboxylesterase/lipase family protein [Lawsonella clevelandensis]|uniref:carboxylesterase/lipase family protein n=1 Tax=Lawsonella clevelandensis TaxID=1528099 RepID=UPI0006B41373|nr:carboxylesterase family protein [Lawsonella clevelandensis]MDU7193363.1 carboxylesterase family protein [Lawsonella clevelandensis]